jgi:hypothetical protein
MLEKEAQVLHGALGVLAELRDIATERLRPSLEQAGKGIKQNALPNRQDFNDLRNRGGKPKHQDAKQWQRAMPLGADAHGKVSRSPCIQVQHAENNRDYQQEQQVREREEKKREKQLLNIENTRSENGEQESERANQRAPFSHGPLSLQNPPVIGCGNGAIRNTE